MKILTPIFLLILPVTAFSQENNITFHLENLEPSEYSIRELSYDSALSMRCGPGVEAWSQKTYDLVCPDMHPFVGAIHYAYAYHRPLTISPDMIWLLILQGFTTHVNANPDSMRHYFVNFEGKKVIRVRRDSFTKGSPENDWENVFPEFTQKISEYTGEELLHNTIPAFSTTTHIEKAAFEVTLMDAMNNYFVYAFYTSCGIPSITLEGTNEDWKLLITQTEGLRQYDLGWWVDRLLPILDQFERASRGKVNKRFWREIYKKRNPGSGAPIITGWILDFFPYWKAGEQYFKSDGGNNKRITTADFPSGLASANFTWFYYRDTFQMEFISGFVGVQQDSETGSLRPEIGWAIRDKGAEGIREDELQYYRPQDH